MLGGIERGDIWRFTLRNISRVSFPAARFAPRSSLFRGSIAASSRRENQMVSGLSAEQIETYERDGFAHPIRIMSTDEARQVRAGFEELETLLGRRVEYAAMTHLFFRWALELSTQSGKTDASS